MRTSMLLPLLLAACLRPVPSRPIFHERAILGVREDGSFVVAEVEETGARLVLLAPGQAAELLAPLPDALVALVRAEGARDEAVALRPQLLASESVRTALVAVGAVPATPLAPVPSSDRRRFSFEDLEVEILLDGEGLEGARLASVRVDRTEVASAALLETSWLAEAVRAGPRVAFVIGSIGGTQPLRRVQSLLVIDLPRSSARRHNREALLAYGHADLKRAQRLLGLSVEADSTYSEGFYNRACGRALQGDVRGARVDLAEAFRLDPLRVRDQAWTDRDLVDLRALPEVRALLGLPGPGPAP